MIYIVAIKRKLRAIFLPRVHFEKQQSPSLRTESPSIFLDKSGGGRNLCRHPLQFILSMLQIQVFCDVNQTVTVASAAFVSKCKCQRERTGSFSPFRSCVSSGFRSAIETISPLESKLAMFQCKKVKKNLRAKVKLTVLFKHKATNLETQKHTERIEIHQSQNTI